MNENIVKIIEKIKSIFGESIFHEKNKKQLISAVKDFAEDEDEANFLVGKINIDNYADKKSVLLKLKADKNSQTGDNQTKNDVASYLETIKNLKVKHADLKQKYKTLQDDFVALKNSISQTQNGNGTDNYEKLRNYLRSIVDVKQETFKKFGLRLTNYGFSSIEQDSFEFNFEIEGNYNKGSNVCIKINIYDSNGHLLKNEDKMITNQGVFSGFNSSNISVSENKISIKANKINVFLGWW